MDTDSFVVNIKTENIYVDIAKDIATRFYTSNYELKRPLRNGKKNSNWINENELDGKIVKEFAALRPKRYSYLTNDNDKNKKVKGIKNCLIKRQLTLKIIKIVYKQLNLEKNKSARKKYN